MFFFQFIYEVKKTGMMVPFKGEKEVNIKSSAVIIIRWTQYISLLVFSYMFPLYVSLHGAIRFSTQKPMSTFSVICHKKALQFSQMDLCELLKAQYKLHHIAHLVFQTFHLGCLLNSVIFIFLFNPVSRWPRSLRPKSATHRLLRLRVRIPAGPWMSVSCECCALRRADRSCWGVLPSVYASLSVNKRNNSPVEKSGVNKFVVQSILHLFLSKSFTNLLN